MKTKWGKSQISVSKYIEAQKLANKVVREVMDKMKPSTESHLKLRIADKDFNLTFIDSKDCLRTSSASSSDWQQTIIICADDRRPDGLMSDLWHEIIEMICACYQIRLDHQVIGILGSAIHQVLRDNPETLLTIAKKGE